MREASPIDVVLRVEAAERKGRPVWRVELTSVAPRAVALVEQLACADLRALPGVPAEVETWPDLVACFSPGGVWTPTLRAMKAIGAIIRTRLLGCEPMMAHLADVESRAARERRPLRFLFEIEPPEDEAPSALTVLPLELAHDDRRFLFKQPDYPAFRCDPRADARNLRLPRRARLLVATAHDDGRDPTREALAAHAEAVSAAVAGIGWSVETLRDATPEALPRALLEGEPIDVLYTACHGLDDPGYAGRLVLRGGHVTGEELGQWLEEADRRGRPVQLALLGACSSATPGAGEGTSGMAQWLAQPRRAVAALGFRGPVLVDWALRFLERIFERIGRGETVEQAFAEVRGAAPNEEPQWVLPLLYVRRGDPGEAQAALRAMRARDVDAPPEILEPPALARSIRQLMLDSLSSKLWGLPAPPDAERADAERLVKRLVHASGTLFTPLIALEIAAATMARDTLSLTEYLEALDLPEGDVIADEELMDRLTLPMFDGTGENGAPAVADEHLIARVLARSLAGAGAGDVRAFHALAALAPDWVSARRLAEALGEPEPRVTRRLDRLVRRRLVMREFQTGLYRVRSELR